MPISTRQAATQRRSEPAPERERLLRLLSDLSAKPMESEWPASPTLGRMSGKDVSRLQAKHLNHHLTQFGV